MPKPVSRRLQVGLFTVILALAGGIWVLRQDAGEVLSALIGQDAPTRDGMSAKPPHAVPVIVGRVDGAPNDVIVSAVGTARARRSVMLYPKSDGVVVGMESKAGDRVSRNDPVFHLDPARAKLAVDIARQNLVEARRLLERAAQLRQRNVNSEARVEDARTVVERTELQLQQAEKTLDDLTVRAPFDGVVGLPRIDVGERVTTATAVVSIDMRREMLLEFEVPEAYVSRIATGDDVAAHTPSHADRTFPGKIEYIDSRVEPTSRTIKVRAVVPNPDDLLRPGMSFVVDLHLPGKTYPTVPELALQWRKGESYVWLVRDGKAERVAVRSIKRLNSIILVDGPLRTGELVVVEGVQRLRPGRPVAYSAPDPSPRTPTSESEATDAARRAEPG